MPASRCVCYGFVRLGQFRPVAVLKNMVLFTQDTQSKFITKVSLGLGGCFGCVLSHAPANGRCLQIVQSTIKELKGGNLGMGDEFFL